MVMMMVVMNILTQPFLSASCSFYVYILHILTTPPYPPQHTHRVLPIAVVSIEKAIMTIHMDIVQTMISRMLLQAAKGVAHCFPGVEKISMTIMDVVIVIVILWQSQLQDACLPQKCWQHMYD